MAKDEHTHGFRRFSRMIIFVLIAALLWLIIKLSDTYSVNVPFAIHYVDIPASHIVLDNDQTAEATITATGFKLLNYYFTFESSRRINISLKEIKYQKDSTSCSYNSQYLAEKIAEFMSINTSDIMMLDDVQTFSMSPLAQKKVKVVPEIHLTFEKQYDYYGEPIISPDSVTVYGPISDIEKVFDARTEEINVKDVKNSFTAKVKLKLDEKLQSDIDNVEISFNVERFTEAKTELPISVPDNIKMNLYPNKVCVRYKVAMKDYESINNMSFKATIDTTDMYFNEKLPVILPLYPNNTQIIDIEPKEVELMIIPQ